MKRTLLFLAIVLAVFSACKQPAATEHKYAKLEIKDGWYYINGEKTFINALGYEIGALPGQHPYQDTTGYVDLVRLERDLKTIKEAGFNAIRTWSEPNEAEMEVVQKSGMKIVFGIGISPDGNFADTAFVRATEDQVRKVMSYSKKFDCIVTYLIMNEPMVAHIYEQGAKATVDLWIKIRDIIHAEHPGIPVTISNNAAIGEYINENIFDVYGFNAYNYGDNLTYTMDFGTHFAFLKQLDGQNKPLVVTEFGMSVSDIGYGLYGGNTLKAQETHVISDLTSTLDGGAAGVCPFYFADGWWKGGEPAVHNPVPEEWFGFRGFNELKDTISYPRPVWYAITRYNQAIITSPRNQGIYTDRVPVEVFLTDKVDHIKAVYDDLVILDKKGLTGRHFTDTIVFTEEKMRDREIVFEFYDKDDNLVKYETILLLTSKEPVVLPDIKVAVADTDLAKNRICKATFTISNPSKFRLSNEVRYMYSHHIGWQAGPDKAKTINPEEESIRFTDSYEIPEKCQVLTVSAGMDIRFGKFIKCIHDEKILYRGHWADAIRVK
jgi:hypothetical protein